MSNSIIIRLTKWLARINRKDWYPSDHDRVCSHHFVSGKVSVYHVFLISYVYYRKTFIFPLGNWAPSLKLGHGPKPRARGCFNRLQACVAHLREMRDKEVVEVETQVSVDSLDDSNIISEYLHYLLVIFNNSPKQVGHVMMVFLVKLS